MENYISIEDALNLKERPKTAARMRQSAIVADVELYISHALLQTYKAIQGQYFDIRYADLFNAADEAKQAFKSDNKNWLCIALFRLGEATARMQLPTECELLKTEHALLKNEYLEAQRTIGLQNYNAEKAQLKQIVQAFAEDFWQKDSHKELRVSDMTDEVYAKTHAVLGKNPIIEYLPEKGAVKDWLREIAPDYAKKGGRPKKTKK
jgi:hypothetical protein